MSQRVQSIAANFNSLFLSSTSEKGNAMKSQNRSSRVLVAAIVMATFVFSTSAARAELIGELGILNGGNDLTGQINPATGAPWQAGDTYRFVFATSTGRDASSSDIADYNNFVNNAANAGGALPGLSGTTWRALASTPTVDAIVNTGLTGASAESFWLVDGTTKISNDFTDFWDGHTSAEAIDVSETGGSPLDNGDFTSLWTGTDSDGTGAAGFELGAAGGISRGGLWGGAASAAQWINRFNLDQTTSGNTGDGVYALYGVSGVLTVQGPPPIPEPASFVLMVLGVAGLIGTRRRRRR